MGMTRRGLLTGALGGAAAVAGAGALVEEDVLPGRVALHRELHLNGSAGTIPDIEPGEVERGTLAGADWWIARPPGATGTLPVVLALHGANSAAGPLLRTMGLDRFLAASGAGFALAGIDGGTHGYWHPRADGRDPRALVIDAFLPMLSQRSSGAARSWSGRRCRPACRPSGRRPRPGCQPCTSSSVLASRAALTGARASPNPKPPSTSGTWRSGVSSVVSPQAHQHEADRRQRHAGRGDHAGGQPRVR
jgi:hypothetical protein